VNEQATLLIVDDMPSNIAVLGEILGEEYNTLFATSGADALRMANEQPIDLILLDIMMPEMDGYEVCRRLKESPITREIPVIFVTAANDSDYEARGINLGAIDYITKPLNAAVVRARIRNHVALQRARDELRLTASVFDNSSEGIIITDRHQRILKVNNAFCRITGYSVSEVCGKTPRLLSSGRHDASFYAAMWQEINDKGSWSGEIWNLRKNGEIYPERITITAIRNHRDEVSQYMALCADISLLHQQQTALERIAHYDPLTGVANRLLLGDRLQQAIIKVDREQKRLAVCLLDLDGFKLVNDTWGHAVGDRLLIAIVQRISAIVREGDTVARLGGDEFVILLNGLDNQLQCQQILDRLIQAIATPIMIADQLLHVSASIGVVLHHGGSERLEGDQLLRRADETMYQVKHRGKNHYLFHHDCLKHPPNATT
jgi:diguanylate cyclase (GGDEF)-like protein/PAS domain S-box-containing protein